MRTRSHSNSADLEQTVHQGVDYRNPLLNVPSQQDHSHLRTRAHTYTDPSVANGHQEQYLRIGSLSPGVAPMNGPWSQPGARHGSSNGAYIPPPPPPSAPPNPQGMTLPPPPPPRFPSSAAPSQTPFIPPPPSQPNNYGMYNRGPTQATYPPPSREPKAYDPTAYAEYMALPPLNDTQPLTSATYIPDGLSWGPGVGNPPLESHQTRSHRPYGYDNFADYNNWVGNNTYQPPPPTSHPQPHQIQNLHHQNTVPPPTPTSRQKTVFLPPAKEREEYQSSPAADSARTPFIPLTSDRISGTVREHPSEAPASPQDQNWPLERVQAWLQSNKFSKEWQAAFAHLGVHGSQFLDIGRSGGQRNIGFMPQTVLPQVARECTANGVVWDQSRERDEGRRLRKAVRQVISDGGGSTPASAAVPALPLRPNRRESNHFLGSAGTESNVESSPDLHTRPHGSSFGSTPSTAGGTGEESPGHSMPSLPPRPVSTSHPRAHTYDSSMNETLRANLTKDVLGTISDIPKRHSPSASSEISAPGNRSFTSSPQQSPRISSAKPAATGAGYRYYSPYSHSRAVSSETSITRQHSNLSPAPGRVSEPQTDGPFAKPVAEDKRRNATDGVRPNIENRNSFEHPSSAKDQKRGFLDKFRKRKDDAHPSPEDERSPASPIPPQPADSAVITKPTNIDTADTQAALPAARAAKDQARKFVFVTPDGWNYRLIDITAVESAEQLRTVICFNLGIDVQDTSNITVHVTSPGQTEHDEALTDQALMNARKSTADAMASLKLYVRTPSSSNGIPESAGLGLNFAQSPPPYVASLADPSLTELIAAASEKDYSSLPEGERRDLLQAKAEEHRKETERKQSAFLEARKSKLDGTRGIHDFDSLRNASSRPTSSGSLDAERKTGDLVPMRKPPPVPEPTSTLRKADSLKKTGAAASVLRTSWPNRKEEPWKRISGGSIREEERKSSVGGIAGALVGAGMAAKAIGTPTSAPGTASKASNLSKSTTAPDLKQPAAQRARGALADINFDQLSGARSTSPRSPFTASKGGQMFKIPYYSLDSEADNGDEDEDTLRASQQPNLKLEIPPNPNVKRIKSSDKISSPELSPATTQPAGRLNRHSTKRGPSFELPERQVDFQPSPAMVSEESEDSDDGLFAVPLRKQQQQKASSARTPSSAKTPQARTIANDSPSRSPNRPELKLKTSKPNVKFVSPSTSDKPGSEDAQSADAAALASASSKYSMDSPEEMNLRRGSQTFSSDMWANRPPAEGIVEHLDEFFPHVDLDQPMAEEAAAEATEGSPVSTQPSTLSTKTSAQELAPSSRSITPLSSADESELSGKDESTMKTPVSVAARSMRKAGGLGRMKSIRDVVKNNYDMTARQGQHTSTSSYASSRASAVSTNAPLNRVSMLRNDGGGIGRRKSTKMFGAKIEQVKPQRGSRLISNLDTIPQDTIPAGNVHHVNKPERQPTFKWMRGQLIGKGTFGRVYLGMNTTTGELLAVKQVEVNPGGANADPAKIREMVKALDIEIDTMKDLDHVNIVQYLGCERKEYSISIFLEYISGGSVGSCLRKHGKFEESVVSSLTRQTLNGLSYLHVEGILHRDLKADNILLDLDGTCKISDFGISKRSANPYNNDITNSMQGSVFWMAPEVIRAQSQPGGALNQTDGADPSQAMNKGYSAKVDIWSLGCVVLEMFAGRRPWSKEEAIGAIYKLGSLNQAPPIPDDVSTNVGPAGLSFMYDCFTIDPGERPTAETLLRAPFCISDPHYNFLDTELYAKIRGAF